MPKTPGWDDVREYIPNPNERLDTPTELAMTTVRCFDSVWEDKAARQMALAVMIDRICADIAASFAEREKDIQSAVKELRKGGTLKQTVTHIHRAIELLEE